jgi:hypothetical protein
LEAEIGDGAREGRREGALFFNEFASGGPGGDAALEAVEVGEAEGGHLVAGPSGAFAGAALDEVGGIFVEGGDLLGEAGGFVVEVDGTGDVALGELVGGSHIEDDGARLMGQFLEAVDVDGGERAVAGLGVDGAGSAAGGQHGEGDKRQAQPKHKPFHKRVSTKESKDS